MDIRETPWLTPESVNFLEQLVNSDPELKILEFGSGGSTIWFSRNLKFPKAKLVTVEHDVEWYQAIRSRVPASVEMRLEERPYARVCNEFPDEYFDLVLIDGRNRILCAAHAMRIVKPGGFIMLDNAEFDDYTPIGSTLLKEWEYRRTAAYNCPEAIPNGVWATDIWRKPCTKNVADVADETLVSCGESYARRGDFATAETLARISIEKNCHIVDALNLLAVSHCSRDEVACATRLLEAGKAMEPTNVNIGKNLALIYSNQGRRDEAMQIYTDLLAIYPMDKDIHNGLRNMGAVELANHAEQMSNQFEALLPGTFLIETSAICNLRCPECALGSGMKKSDKHFMSLDQFKHIADKIRPYAKTTLLHIWGEPMLNKDIFEMIKIASEFSTVNISTNGLMLTPKTAEKLITSGVGELIVSIDGISQEVYEKYRVGGNVENAINALKMLAEFNNKHGNKVWIIPQFIVFKHNQHEMAEFESLCDSLGLKACFKAPYLRDGSESDMEISGLPSFHRKQFPDDASLCQAISTCDAPKKDFTVLVDGSVVLCCYDHNGTTGVGNIFEQDVMDIWNSDAYRDIRWKVLSGNAPEFCKKSCLTYSLAPKQTLTNAFASTASAQPSGRRARVTGDVSDLRQAIENAREMFRGGKHLEAFDLYEQLTETYPQHSVQIMADLYSCYATYDQNDRYNLYQKRLFDFDIKSTDKVLDIGSGHAPFPLATHLSDLELGEGWTGRAGAPFKYVDGKPVYQCDIESLPFADNEFDFVYCSHVLEHVKNPEIACRELMRVAKRGYIETPTRGKELWLDSARESNHRWAIELFNDTLVFTEYTPKDINGIHCNSIGLMHMRPESDREKAISSMLYLKADLFNTMLMWDGSFKYDVRRLEDSSSTPSAPPPAAPVKNHVNEPVPEPPVATEAWMRETVERINCAGGNPKTLLAIASELAERGQVDTAEQLARMVLSADGSNAEAHNVMGCIYCSREQFNEALHYFENARRLDSRNTDIGKNLVNVYRTLRRFEDATALCQEMLHTCPDDAELVTIVGDLLEEISDRIGDAASFTASPGPAQKSTAIAAPAGAPTSAKRKPNLKYSFGMIVLNGDDFIECAIKSVYDFAHEIIIVEGAVEEAVFAVGPDGGSRDNTIKLIEEYPDPENKITLIRGRWKDKTHQSNVYLQLATGDYVWELDSDEVYKEEDLYTMDNILTENRDRVDMVSFYC
ncbi:MAG: methyltransferase domain-containing protein, partial [Armatimonadetes bacterium]|nr:methyltransferase domain-containing protein [Armatimonadota bacterium]